MIQTIRWIIVSIFFFTIGLDSNALDLTKQDFKYLYDPYSPVGIKHKLSQNHGVYTLFFKLSLKNPLRKENKFQINLLVQNGYKAKNSLALDAKLVRQDSAQRQMLLEYRFEVPSNYDLVVGQFIINNVFYYYDIPVNSGLSFPCSDVLPLQSNRWPYFDRYIQAGSTIAFDSSVAVYQYLDQFATAKPPMSTRTSSGSNNIEIDSVFQSFEFSSSREKVLSFVQTDSTSNSGCSFLAVSQYYPKLRRVNDLIEPIIYLGKKEEFDRVQNAAKKKKAFDQFWISIIPSQDRARAVLKRYFENVARANYLFTDYKEGWRTDRGMIYIIYGYPKEVHRTKDKEIWSYTINGKSQNFSFAKVPNLFVQQHHVLVRDKDLSKIWLNEVSKWRKGNM